MTHPPCWICKRPNDRATWDDPGGAEACRACEDEWHEHREQEAHQRAQEARQRAGRNRSAFLDLLYRYGEPEGPPYVHTYEHPEWDPEGENPPPSCAWFTVERNEGGRDV